MNQLPMVESEQNSTCCRWSNQKLGFGAGLLVAAVAAAGFFAGRLTSPPKLDGGETLTEFSLPKELLNATSTHGGTNLAVCTGPLDEDAEGLFTLDYLTGELKAWVYYPRFGRLGGFFVTNVQPFLGVSNKNPEYLLVTGTSRVFGQSSNVRPSQSQIYVVDAKSGYFAAFSIPWNGAMANSGAPQNGTFTFIDGGQIREPQGGAKKPINPPKAPGPGAVPGAGPAAGNNPANPAGGVPGPAQPGAGKQP